MSLLLDTHILLWWLAASQRLSTKARIAIEDADSIFVSSASAWEISIKVARGNLEFRGDFVEQVALSNFIPLPLSSAHAWAAGQLPRLHGDPFDWMLVAQAQAEGLTLLTADKKQAEYDVPVVLA